MVLRSLFMSYLVILLVVFMFFIMLSLFSVGSNYKVSLIKENKYTQNTLPKIEW